MSLEGFEEKETSVPTKEKKVDSSLENPENGEPEKHKKREEIPEEMLVKAEEKPDESELERLRAEIEKTEEGEGDKRDKIKEIKKEKLELIKETVEAPEEYKELIGDDSEESWQKRTEKAKEDPINTLESLAGVASEKSREMLKEYLGSGEKQKFWFAISRGLIGDNSSEAWEMRNWLKFDQNVGRLRGGKFAETAKRIGYNKSEWYFKLRSTLKKWPLGLYAPGDALISATGISSEDEKKAQLIGELEELCPAEALLSLRGDNSELAKKIREKYKDDKRLRWAYKKSL